MQIHPTTRGNRGLPVSGLIAPRWKMALRLTSQPGTNSRWRWPSLKTDKTVEGAAQTTGDSFPGWYGAASLRVIRSARSVKGHHLRAQSETTVGLGKYSLVYSNPRLSLPRLPDIPPYPYESVRHPPSPPPTWLPLKCVTVGHTQGGAFEVLRRSRPSRVLHSSVNVTIHFFPGYTGLSSNKHG